MEKEIINWIEKNDRDEVVRFLKSLWNEKPQPCPFCGGELDFLHKKAKKSNCDWICTVCKQKYDTIEMLKRINDE